MARGGKRPGAGRKPTKLSRLSGKLKRSTAEEILNDIDEKSFWIDLLTATTLQAVRVIGGEDGERESISVPDYRTRLEAGKYLTDRRDGKAPQAIEHIGEPVLRVVIDPIRARIKDPASA